MDRVDLTEAIETIRTELLEAVDASVDAALRFPIASIELEFEVSVARDREGTGKVKFWIVEVGGRRSSEERSRHTVTVTLGVPIDAEGRPVEIADRSHAKP